MRDAGDSLAAIAAALDVALDVAKAIVCRHLEHQDEQGPTGRLSGPGLLPCRAKGVTAVALDAIAARLNHRPRRVLGWATPARILEHLEPALPQLHNPTTVTHDALTG